MIRILISSVGRRNYLLGWFRDAASSTGCEVELIGADGDPSAPALMEVDRQVILPPISSDSYVDALVNACQTHHVNLLFSLHDYDIATISSRALERLRGLNVVAAVPPKETLDVVADKLLMIQSLSESGLLVPPTETAINPGLVAMDGQMVVKHRYGSGSSGVFIVEQTHLASAIIMSALTAPEVDGSRPKAPDNSFVIVQEKITGQEYGIDIVCDFKGNYQGVLARKKLRMRAGETDRAISVDAASFDTLARTLSKVLSLRGSTDVDIIVTPEGEQYIIDINPRFGGGYPFVHMAGANVPACYLAWATGREIEPSWLQYEVGVISNKYQAIQRSS